MEHNCKYCGTVVKAVDGANKVFCSQCGNVVFDSSMQSVGNQSTKAKSNTPVIIVLSVIAVALLIAVIAIVGIFVVKPSNDYKLACELMNNGNYIEAVAAFEELEPYKDSSDRIVECMYNMAQELYADGEYEKALDLYKKLGDYSDSKELAEKSVFKLQQQALKSSRVGDIVRFGVYEQDNNLSNGAEVIEWQVLEVNGNQRLLISRYGIDCRQYDSRNMELTWAKCELRSWLNGEFMQTAFSAERQNMIIPTSVTNESNPFYGTWGGNNTVDNIYLLSYNEAASYFPVNEQRRAQPTAFTAFKNAEIKEGNCWWWLRTPGVYGVDVCGVHHNGELDPKGVYVYGQRSAVRPVMWVIVE